MKQVCDYEQCYGCCACYNQCPKNAIFMGHDNWGNLVPVIDQEKCVDCGLCTKVCPAIQKTNFSMPEIAYAAITKNEKDYVSATSGGIATAFSKYVIGNHGVVYGAAFVKGTAEVKHIRADSLDGLEQLKGSKYVQSNIDDTFRLVKEDVKSGRQVIFIGTPCQVDGLHTYLQKKYKNLITVNFVCHGVPSGRLFCEHIENIIEERDNLNIRFRSKNKFQLIVKKEEKTCSNPFYKDYYFLGFMRKLFYRNACYICKYAQQERVGDFTIGDFWGFDEKRPFPMEHPNGLSLILINSIEGKEYFEEVKESLIYQQRSVNEAIKGNPQLNHPSKKNANFMRFRKLYERTGFERAAKKVLWPYKIAYSIYFFVQKLKKK